MSQQRETGDGAARRGRECGLLDLDDADELSADAFRAFVQVLHLHRRLMIQALGDRDAHPGQALCLRRLACEDGLAQKELAETMFLAPPTVSRMLKTMEEGGLIERRPDADDQRLTRVFITDAGRRLGETVRTVTGGLVEETFGSLPPADRRELARLLDELGAGIERAIGRREETAARRGEPA
jgi:DNA-binding MarR family transcriptional regulator